MLGIWNRHQTKEHFYGILDIGARAIGEDDRSFFASQYDVGPDLWSVKICNGYIIIFAETCQCLAFRLAFSSFPCTNGPIGYSKKVCNLLKSMALFFSDRFKRPCHVGKLVIVHCNDYLQAEISFLY